MPRMTKVTDSKNRSYRITKQQKQTTCGPAACLIMWANVYDSDPQADEAGVITLSRMFPKPWDARTGAEINNLVSVLRQMNVRAVAETHSGHILLRDALVKRVQPKKPVLAFLEWETASSVKGHFVVVGAATKANDQYTILDPMYGLNEMSGLPFYYPFSDEDPPPELKFTGAIAYVE